MNPGLMLISVALVAGLSAGCDKTKQAGDPSKPAVPQTGNAAPLPQISSSAAANASEKSKTPPIQGQVDSRELAQTRDFKTNK
jgi:hypothetical protein